MRKLALKVLILGMAICSALFVFTACGENPISFKLNFVVDNEIVRTIDIAGNETIMLPENPVKDGYNFDGWFWDKDVWEKPFTANSLLDAPLSGDMSVYAKFTKNHEHNYTAVVTAPTCTEKGCTTYTCACGDSYNDDYVDELGHDYNAAVTAPTCTEQGYTTHTCTRCQNSYIDTYTTATGHEFGDWILTKAPNCTETGIQTRYCSHDNTHTETRTVSALTHDYIAVVTDPTCTEQGYTTHTCSRCSDSYIDGYVGALNHNYGSPSYTWSADNKTCTAERICLRDGNHKESETVETTCEIVQNKSCETDELTTYTATFKNPVFSKQTKENVKTQERTGHDYGDPIWIWNETTAIATFICKKDSNHIQTIDAIVTNVTTSPTCVENGQIIYTATVEFNTKTYTDVTTVVLPALGHEYKDGVCERDGVKQIFYATFVADGEIIDIVEFTVEDTEIANVPQVPKKVGYTGVWAEHVIVADNITINAIYTINKYTVTFKNYDGTVLYTTAVNYGDIVSYEGSTPEKAGNAQYNYTFAGWNPSVVNVTGDAIYIAKFNENTNQYTVTFKNYDGTVLYTTNVNYGGNATYGSTTPQRQDGNNKSYIFDKWDISLNNITSDIVANAIYITYDVYSFVYKNGVETTVKVFEGTSIIGKIPANTDTVTSGNVETSYYWELESTYRYQEQKNIRGVYYIAYELDGGANSTKNPVKVYDDESITLYDANKAGYTFSNWYLNSEKVTPITKLENIGSNITLYADYTPTSYLINYHLFDGTNSIKNPSTYTIEDEIIFKDASKIGYTFNGWYTDSSMTKSISQISNSMGNMDLYAKFTPLKYSGAFVNDDVLITLKVAGYSDIVYTVPYGETFDPYSEEVMSHYLSSSQNNLYSYNKFIGWSTSPNSSSGITGTTKLKGDTTLYGAFGGEHGSCYYSHYTVSRCLNATECSTTIEKDYYLGSSDLCYSKEYGNRCFTVPSLCDGSITFTFDLYYAKCRIYVNDRNVYSYSVDYVNPDTNVCSVTLNLSHDDHVAVELDYRGNSPEYSRMCCHVSINRRKSWNLISDNASYQSIYYDEHIDLPNPTKIGYDLVGWQDEGGRNITDIWQYTSNTSFRAQWAPTAYTIKYNLDGGINSQSNPSAYTIEDSFDLQKAYKTGYTFCGWYTDSSFLAPISGIHNSTGSLTLYAKFTVNTYTLNLDSSDGAFAPKVEFISDGNVIKTEYLNGSKSIEKYCPDGKNGYIFGGWFIDENCTTVFNFNKVIKENIKLYAKWISTTYDTLQIETIPSPIQISINGKTEIMYQFVPLADSLITITSVSDLDLVGALYDNNKNILISADDIYEDNLNFTYTYNVYAGEIYYIGIKGNTVATVGTANIDIQWVGSAKITGTTYINKTINVEYGTEYVLPDYVEKEGYTFVGWYDNQNVKYESGIWYYANNITLHAVFE